jgi:hypothetical protein
MSLALASRLNAVLRNGRHPEDSRSLERVEGSCVHGKVGFSKIGWYVLLDNQQEIYFFPGRSSDWESSAEMRGKLVTATGVLRFSQCPKNPLTDKEGRVINKEGRIIDRCSDYYYFDDQPSQVRPAPGA